MLVSYHFDEIANDVEWRERHTPRQHEEEVSERGDPNTENVDASRRLAPLGLVAHLTHPGWVE